MSLIEKLNFLCANNEVLHRFSKISYDLNKDPLCADEDLHSLMVYVIMNVKK